MNKRLRLALTTGEPAGIGPDLVLMLASQTHWAEDVIALADIEMLRARARLLKLSVRLRAYTPDQDQAPCQQGELFVLHIPCVAPVTPGSLDSRNASYVLELLKQATLGCQSGEFAAMVTAPLHKGIINEAGVAFTGHTEYLAELTAAPLPVMLLAAGNLRVALATTHLPLNKVSAAITAPLLRSVLKTLDHDLRTKFGIKQPRILVCGLNPHAGEGGYLGMEEIDVIIPTLRQLQQQGLHLTGPLPADTLFTPRNLLQADAVLAMYHDQGLPVLKHAGFGKAVNITLGLPIIRTSVDHGTALDLAGTGNAESGSLKAAIQLAMGLSRSQEQAKSY